MEIFNYPTSSVIRHKLYDDVNNTLYTQHNGIPPEPASNFVPLYESSKVAKYFDADSRIIFQNPVDLYELPNDELLPLFQNDLEDFYDYVTENLKQGHGGYFNCHRWPHIYRATTSAVDLAQQLGIDPYSQKLLMIAGSLHDTGNAGSRADHDRLGAKIGPFMYPGIYQRSMEAEIIKDTIFRHNEGPYRSLRGYNGAPAEVRNRTLCQTYLSPISPLLFMGDKAEIDPSRAEQNALNETDLEWHNHSALNLFGVSKGFKVDQDGITWEIGFDPRVPQVEGRDYSAITRKTLDGDMLRGPSYLRKNPEDKDSDIDPMKVWRDTWKLYGPKEPTDASRLTGLIDAGLTLSHQVNINYVNDMTGEVIDYRSFTLDNMDAEVAKIIEEQNTIQ